MDYELLDKMETTMWNSQKKPDWTTKVIISLLDIWWILLLSESIPAEVIYSSICTNMYDSFHVFLPYI